MGRAWFMKRNVRLCIKLPLQSKLSMVFRFCAYIFVLIKETAESGFICYVTVM